MKNWSTNTKELKQNKDKFAIWQLEQLVNFGLDKKKIDQSLLKKYWDLIEIDPSRRKFLALILR